MKTNKILSILSTSLLLGAILTGCNTSSNDSVSSVTPSTATSSEQTTGSFTISEGKYECYSFEWGPAVTKIVLKLSGKVQSISKTTFNVFAGSSKIADADMVQATVEDAYVADSTGAKATGESEYIAFELKGEHNKCSPFDSDSMTLMNGWATYKAKLVLNSKLTVGSKEVVAGETVLYTFKDSERKTPEFDNWEKGSFTNGEQTLTTIAYTPANAKTDGGKNPLVVWLHGAGGGGTDPIISAMDTQLVNFTKSPIQDYFTTETQKGAYVLSVQTPTFWCNDGNGGYNSSLGTDDAFGKGQPGMYTDTLYKTIKDYVEKHTDVDPKRVYVGGCSNGGYMTMELMINHNDFFAAYYPICEGYRDYFISDTVINNIKGSNVYFVQAEGDELFPPMEFTVPTYYRLLNAGANNAHFAFFDATSLYGKGYIQHYSWTYVFNNQVKYDFNKAQVLADYTNIDWDDKHNLAGQSLYVSNANNTVEISDGLFGWMSQQVLA